MQKNTLGTPNTDLYSLGRGRLYFALLDVNDKPLGYRDLGNSPDFKTTLSSDTLKHQSSRAGLKTTDKEITITQDLAVAFQLDEFSAENLAALFAGTVNAYTNVAIAGFAAHVMIADSTAELGKWYNIVNSTGGRAYDTRAADLTITTNETTPVAMVLGTDYTVDQTNGLIFLISTSTVLATAIAALKGVKVTLAARAGAKTVTEVRTMTTSAIDGSLKFIGVNPANNDEETEFEFHSVSLKADGDLSLIGDDWSKAQFKATCGKSSNSQHSTSPTLTIRALNAA